MRETRFEDRVGCFGCGLADLPDADSVVHAAGNELFAVGTERDGVLLLERLRKGVAPFAGRQVPEFHRAVRAGAGENFSVRPEGQTEHRAVVAGKRFDFLAGLDVPQPDLLVVAAGGERLAVRRDSQGVDRVLVAFEHVEQMAVGKVPLPRFAEPSGFAACGKKEFAIGRKRHGVHVATMAFEGAYNRARLGRTQLDLSIAGDGDEFFGRQVSNRVDRFARWHLRLDLRREQLPDFHFHRRFGSGVNPGLDERDLVRLELGALFSRGHDQGLAVLFDPAFDHFHQQALRAFAGNDHGAALAAFHQQFVRFHDQLALRLGRSVAIEAIFGDDRVNGGVIRRFGGPDGGGGEEDGGDREGEGAVLGKPPFVFPHALGL